MIKLASCGEFSSYSRNLLLLEGCCFIEIGLIFEYPGRKCSVNVHFLLTQVDDLKAKLAAQEVELAQKNEAANKLIQVVGAETEKVSLFCHFVLFGKIICISSSSKHLQHTITC